MSEHNTLTPTAAAEIVAFHADALMSGEPLPAPTSQAAAELLQAISAMLQSAAYPHGTAAARNQLALSIIRTLNRRLGADIHTARALGKASRND